MLIKNPARVRPVQFNPLNQPPPTTITGTSDFFFYLRPWVFFYPNCNSTRLNLVDSYRPISPVNFFKSSFKNGKVHHLKTVKIIVKSQKRVISSNFCGLLRKPLMINSDVKNMVNSERFLFFF